ncbi:hypothetical protein SJAV_26530 [Sulfurisphaera javensis]|uniref:Uncharacterized protein n=1 Tax=Sulfurisphaera javensis TaxID=2049879 RepID=A0AAT9GV92_9CREN
MESCNKGHDKILYDYLSAYLQKISNHSASYLHDIFKALFVKGDSESEDKSTSSLEEMYRNYDRIASIAEQSKCFIPNNVKIMNILKNLPSYILNPLNLSPIIYLSKNLNLFKTTFQPKFKDLSEIYLKDYLDSKYGNNTFNNIKYNICSKQKLDIKSFEVLVDSIRFFPQRSWISGNDISLLAHLRGALLASLEDIYLVEINNPFYSNFITLKDAEGVYAITKVFLYHLNNCLFEKVDQNFNEILKSIADVDKLTEYSNDLYNSPLIDFFTPFVFSADHEKIRFFVKNKDHIEECIKEGINKTLDEVLDKWISKDKLIEDSVSINVRIVAHEHIDDKDEKYVENAEILNNLLSVNEKGGELTHMQITFQGAETSNELCEVCKRRKAVKLNDKLKEILGNDVKLCNVCLAVRLSPFHVGRSSSLKKGDEEWNLNDIKNNGWNYFFISSGNKGRSIDDITDGSDDVIFIAMKLNLKNYKERIVELNKYYDEMKDELYNLVKDDINKYLGIVKEILLSENISKNKGFERVKNIYEKLKEKMNFDESLSKKFFDTLIMSNRKGSRIDFSVVTDFIIHEFLGSENTNITEIKKLPDIINIIKEVLRQKSNDLNNIGSIILSKINTIKNLREKLRELKEVMKSDSVGTTQESTVKTDLVRETEKVLVDIPKSLDREFSIRLHFSILGEELLAMMYYKRIKQLILINPSTFTPLVLTVIRKSDLSKFIEILKELNNVLGDEISPISNSVLIYLIKAKSYTPISIIFYILNEEIDEKGNSDSIGIVPVIVGRNNIPIGPLNVFSLKEFCEEYEKLPEDIESFSEFFETSSEDIPYPEFKNYKKFVNDNIYSYVQEYIKREKKAPFSIKYKREDKLRAYIARLLM